MDYILWLIAFIFFLSIIILILYIYQKNSQNTPENPVITNFGVTISDQEGDRLATLETLVTNVGTSASPNFINRNFMIIASDSISRGDTSTGWIIQSVDNVRKDTVSLQNNYTGNFMTWNPNEGGNIEVFESNSKSQPPDPNAPGSNGVGWFKLKLVKTVVETNGVPDEIVQLQSLNPANRFLTIGQAVGGNDSGRNLMVLSQETGSTTNTFRISTSQGKNASTSVNTSSG